MTLYLLYFVLIVVFAYFVSCYKEYKNAKPKHRLEYIDVYWFVGKFYGKTYLSVPRSTISFFSIFEKKFIGLGFQGCRVFVINEKKEYLLCKFKQPKNGFEYDIGAGGYVKSGETVLECANAEYAEELNIGDIVDSPLEYIGVVTPAHGFHCIVHCYITFVGSTCSNDKMSGKTIDFISSPDDTYVGYSWRSKKELVKLKNTIKDDGYNFMLNCLKY